MRAVLLAIAVACAGACCAVDVGILDSSRLLTSVYNVQTGPSMATMKALWEARGAVWHQTDVLTPAFLSTVSVFFTSQVGPPELSTEEQAALAAWVREGNTLIVTGDCG